jgi:hypothetical protein
LLIKYSSISSERYLSLSDTSELQYLCYSIAGIVSFFVLVDYHTPYAMPWIFPPLALYGLDLVIRMLRYRVKEATLVAEDSSMTLVSNTTIVVLA